MLRRISDPEALDVIQELMTAREWNADTLRDIYEIVQLTGRKILPPAQE